MTVQSEKGAKIIFVINPRFANASVVLTVPQIKTAARKLPAKDRADLLVDFAMDDAVQREQLTRLRAAIDEGIADHAAGRYIELETDEDFKAFATAIKREGRARLNRAK